MAIENEDLERDYSDDQERKQFQDYKAGNRKMPLSNNVLMLLGGLLEPQTEGFNQINLDMSFSNLDYFSLLDIKNSSFLVNYFTLWGLGRALYLERGKLATDLIARRSLNGKSMDLFTNVTTTQKQEFQDKTEKKTGWARIFGGKKNTENAEG